MDPWGGGCWLCSKPIFPCAAIISGPPANWRLAPFLVLSKSFESYTKGDHHIWPSVFASQKLNCVFPLLRVTYCICKTSHICSSFITGELSQMINGWYSRHRDWIFTTELLYKKSNRTKCLFAWLWKNRSINKWFLSKSQLIWQWVTSTK